MVNLQIDSASPGRLAFWSLGGSTQPANAGVPPGQAFLWLDPATTSPNVLLGLDVPGRGRFYMRPGDVVPMDKRAGNVRVWNALRRNIPSTFLASANRLGLVGFVGLRAGTVEELGAVVATREKGAAHPLANLLFAGVVAVSTNIYVPTANVTGLRVSCWGWADPSGAPTAPLDFSASMQVAAGIPRAPGALTMPALGAVPLPGMEEEAGDVYESWNAGQRLTFAGGGASIYDSQLSHDVAVVAGSAAMVLRLENSIVGTAAFLSGAYLWVEGR
ncbi:MAG: hypothetical protein IPO08_21860 [Xanthomonadales bacterium]|nr:hypothetical protein [Xanthomonadales bacterium]